MPATDPYEYLNATERAYTPQYRLTLYNLNPYDAVSNRFGLGEGGQAYLWLAVLADMAAVDAQVASGADRADAASAAAEQLAADTAAAAANGGLELVTPPADPIFNALFDAQGEMRPLLSFSRASTATVIDSSGIIRTVPVNKPRFDHDPLTGECLGLLIEEARTRLNAIAAAPTTLENVTVTAVAHTISFYGTGTITLSGAHAATVVGLGAYPSRKTYTFTPSAGTLTITPSGGVADLQVEVGSFATSVIRGEGSQVPRAADVCILTLSSLVGPHGEPLWNGVEGTLVVGFDIAGRSPTGVQTVCELDDGSSNNRVSIFATGTTGLLYGVVTSAGTTQAAFYYGSPAVNTLYRFAVAFAQNDFVSMYNGGNVQADTSGVPPVVTTLHIGKRWSGDYLNGHIRQVTLFNRRLSNAMLQAIQTLPKALQIAAKTSPAVTIDPAQLEYVLW